MNKTKTKIPSDDEEWKIEDLNTFEKLIDVHGEMIKSSKNFIFCCFFNREKEN